MATDVEYQDQDQIKIKISTDKIVTQALAICSANYCRNACSLLERLIALSVLAVIGLSAAV